MQINLDVLINYLNNNKSFNCEDLSSKEINDKFNLKFLESINSGNFNRFNNFFKNHVERIGVYINDSKKNKISLLSSILFCIDEDFCTLQFQDQEFYINTLNNKIKSDTIDKKFKIKNISKQMIISNLKNKKTTNNLDIYIYSSYFKINIFIFDFNSGEIILYYPELEFNFYKKNIFISKNEDQYNPLVYKNNNGRHFKYNSSILEDILYNYEIKTFTLTEKQFIICNDWDILLKNYDKKEMSTIIVDLDETSNLLLNQIMKSDSSDEIDKLDYNMNYESDENTLVSTDHDFENLTDELNAINEVTYNIEELDSDDLNLDDSYDDKAIEINIVENNNTNTNTNTNTNLVNELKQISKSKLLREKKDKLLEYLTKLMDNTDSNIIKSNKKDLVDKIFNIVNQDI